jgi:PAS domain S-box-containing protein
MTTTQPAIQQQALNEACLNLDAFMKATSDIVVIKDCSGVLVACSDAFCALQGRARADIVGKTEFDFLELDLARQLEIDSQQVIERGQTVVTEHCAQTILGTRWYEAVSVPWRNLTGDIVGVLRSERDITHHKEAEVAPSRFAHGMSALYETSLELNAQKDSSSLLQAIVRRATQLVEAQMGGLYLLRPDGKTLEMAVSYNAPSTYSGITLHVGEGLAGRVAQTGRALAVDDYSLWDGRAEVYEGAPFRRVLAVPLRSGDRIIGVVNIDGGNRPRRFDDDEVRLVSLFADQAAIAIENGRLYEASQRELAERRRAEEALRRERDFIASILDTAEVLVVVLDPQGWIMMFNRKCQQVSGYTEQEVLGRVVWDFLIPPEHVERVRQALTISPSQRPPRFFENPWLTKDGRCVPVIWSNSIVWDAAGAPVYLIVTGLDASDRVAREREIQQRNQELTVVYQVVRAASTSLDPMEVFKQVTTTLAEVGQYPIVTTYVKVDGRFRLCAQVGQDDAPLLGVSVGIHGRVIRTGKPQFVPDVTDDPDYYSVSPEVTAEICVPVTLDGEIVGTLNVESNELRPLTDSDFRLLLALADQMSLLMRNALLHRNLKIERDHVNWINQQLLALQAVGTAVLSRLDIQELLNFIARSATELLGGQTGSIWLIGDDGTLNVHGAFSLRKDAISPEQYELSRQSVNMVTALGEPIVVGDLLSDNRFDSASLAHEGFLSMISAPLFVGKTVIGALNVYSTTHRDAFDPDDLQILSLLANQAAVAIEKAQLYAATAESEVRYRSLFEDNLDGIVLTDAVSGQILEANAAFQQMVGYSLSELRQRRIFDLRAPQQQQQARDEWASHVGRGISRGRLVPYLTKDGRLVEAEFSARVIDLGARRVEISSVRDVTETQRLEEQLRQSQKMEAIGTLASGIAHDFNNILGAVLGYASFIKSTLSANDPRRADIEVIENSARRGAELTAQLLAFARGGPQDVRPISLNIMVKEVLRLLSRTVDKSVSMRPILQEQLGTIDGDAGQIQQVLLNLCINACEAMPGGGLLTVETRKVQIGEENAPRELGKPGGAYVLLVVSDTGQGMDPETQERIFEPFFSTKKEQPGKKHSGLGLATVFGIVRGHGGVIRAESEVGRGTSFSIWLPAGTAPVIEEKQPAPLSVRGGDETILVVDDEVPIRALMERILSQAGYRVLVAADGASALELLRTQKPIHLVILDMVMPGLSGLKTFQAMQQIDPEVVVLVSTGYSEKGQAKEVLAQGAQGFMQKPFTLQDMLHKVRTVLDAHHQ